MTITFSLSTLLLFAAVVMQVAATVYYLVTLFKKKTILNPVSWGLWTALTFLNTFSYYYTVFEAQFAIMPALSALSTLAVFATAAFLHQRARIDWLDEAALIIGIVACAAWVASGNATFASVILQIAFMVGFLPTYRSIIRGTSHEPLGPWLLWFFAYIANIIALVFSGSQMISEYIYPMTALILHAGVVSLVFATALFRSKRGSHKPAIKAVGL